MTNGNVIKIDNARRFSVTIDGTTTEYCIDWDPAALGATITVSNTYSLQPYLEEHPEIDWVFTNHIEPWLARSEEQK